MNPSSLLLRGLIRGYQLLISPVLPASCRFYPSCSAYGLEAIGRHGALMGTYLTIRRICRCHPWNEGGYDPVPERNHNSTACGHGPTRPPDRMS
jgi:uncharacterized protein